MSNNKRNVLEYNIKELDLEIIAPSTKKMNDPDQGGSKTVVIGKPGTGKCMGKGTPIIMYDGSVKNVEDIKEGELLMGDDSTPRRVLSTCSGRDNMYEIIQLKGDNYVVNSVHILSLKFNKYRDDRNGDIIDIPLNEYILKNNYFKSCYKGYKVGVEFEEKELDNDAYDFGSNLLSSELNEIPKEYKINSRENRLKLLAGILDSEGMFNGNTSFELFNNKEKLISDIVFVARSLGFLSYFRNIHKNENGEILKKTKCYISGDLNLLPFKVFEIEKKENLKDNLLSVIKVKYLGEGDYYGFELDGNKRFLLGDFTVTHNTTLISSLLYAKKHIFPVAIAMSGSEDSNGFYRRIMPSSFVFNDYDEEKIKEFIRRQKLAKKHIENPWGIILLDDCTDDPRIFNNPLQAGMYKRGRHWKMWYILSLQYAMDVKPVIRTNVDGVFILREPILKNRKSLWENYASVIPDFHLFCEIMDQLTDNYSALYIHNASRSNDWQDCVFWYKASIPPEDFKFGCPEYWNFHNERFNHDYIETFEV